MRATHWEVECRCRLWGRSRRCGGESGRGRSAARPWALESGRRWSSSAMTDGGETVTIFCPQGNKTPAFLKGGKKSSALCQRQATYEEKNDSRNTPKTAERNVYPGCSGGQRRARCGCEPRALTQLLGRVASITLDTAAKKRGPEA